MTLPNHMDRCQGRLAHGTGGATLARDCIDCQRRTAIEPGQTYGWMTPPQIVYRWAGCPSYQPPHEEDVTE